MCVKHFISTSFITFFISASAYSQQAAPPDLAIASKFFDRANVDDQKEIIPLSLYYRLVLRDIVQNPSTISTFSEKDIEILNSLQSPSSRFFLEDDIREMNEFCSSLSSPNRIANVENFAGEFSRRKEASERRVENYYQREINKLSAGARLYIDDKLAELLSSNQVAYTQVNVLELSNNSPDIALRAFDQFCTRQDELASKDDLRDITLKEEVSAFRPIELTE